MQDNKQIILTIAEMAKDDEKALSLMLALDNAIDWGEEDMILCAMESFLKSKKGELH